VVQRHAQRTVVLPGVHQHGARLGELLMFDEEVGALVEQLGVRPLPCGCPVSHQIAVRSVAASGLTPCTPVDTAAE